MVFFWWIIRCIWYVEIIINPIYSLQALISFFEMPTDESTMPDDHFIEIEDTPSFQTTSAKLNFASNSKPDPLQGNLFSTLISITFVISCQVFITNIIKYLGNNKICYLVEKTPWKFIIWCLRSGINNSVCFNLINMFFLASCNLEIIITYGI